MAAPRSSCGDAGDSDEDGEEGDGEGEVLDAKGWIEAAKGGALQAMMEADLTGKILRSVPILSHLNEMQRNEVASALSLPPTVTCCRCLLSLPAAVACCRCLLPLPARLPRWWSVFMRPFIQPLHLLPLHIARSSPSLWRCRSSKATRS